MRCALLAVFVLTGGCAGPALPVDEHCQVVECTPDHNCADATLVCNYAVGNCVVPEFVGDCGDRGEPPCPPGYGERASGCNQGTEPRERVCQVIELHPMVCVVVR